MSRVDQFALGWFGLWSVVTFLAFGWDKWRASRGAERISELTLVLLSALGGWPGGLAGMILFRHKTAKWSFKLKFALALFFFAAEVWGWWCWARVGRAR
jgi:uncharacterized membrane protein YsdA (DUF1294 family)